MKVVLDTNVYVSGHLFKGGIPSRLIDLARDKKYDLFYSPEILQEFEKVLEQKFGLDLHERDALIRWLEGAGKVVYPKKKLQLIKQSPPDNRILECALEADAAFVVTGDKRHLLNIRHPFRFHIVTPSQFYRVLFEP